MVKPWSRVGDELDRAVELLGRQRDQRGARRHLRLGAERAADEGADHVHLVGVDPELLRDAVLEPIDELARLIDRQLVVAPYAGGGEQLERIVMLRRRGVFGIELDLGRGERRFGVARLRQFLVPLADLAGVLLVTPGEPNVALGLSAA